MKLVKKVVIFVLVWETLFLVMSSIFFKNTSLSLFNYIVYGDQQNLTEQSISDKYQQYNQLLVDIEIAKSNEIAYRKKMEEKRLKEELELLEKQRLQKIEEEKLAKELAEKEKAAKELAEKQKPVVTENNKKTQVSKPNKDKVVNNTTEKPKEDKVEDKPVVNNNENLRYDLAQLMFEQINQHRSNNGKKRLVWSNRIYNAAAVRAKEITKSFSHTRPNGQRYNSVDVNAVFGENIAKAYRSVDKAMEGFINSTGHNDNMLHSFESGAVAIIEVNKILYFVQLFGY